MATYEEVAPGNEDVKVGLEVTTARAHWLMARGRARVQLGEGWWHGSTQGHTGGNQSTGEG